MAQGKVFYLIREVVRMALQWRFYGRRTELEQLQAILQRKRWFSCRFPDGAALARRR